MRYVKNWRLKTQTLDLSQPRIMAILNATPDSFSDGGRFAGDSKNFSVDVPAVVAAGRKALRDGAVILDVGGESTRPGGDPVDEAEELRRVIPVVKALKEELNAIVSIDTYRPSVADAALEAGAEIVNDIAAGRYLLSQQRFAGENETGFPEEMAEVVAKHNAAAAIMHMRGVPKTMQAKDPVYPNGVMNEVYAFLQRRRDAFLNAGVSLEQLAVDPGFGFGKTFEQNWELLRETYKLHELGTPLLVGDSRKRFLVESAKRYNESRGREADADVDPVAIDTRDFATSATTTFMARQCAQVIRVHNVARSAFMLELARRAGELDAWNTDDEE